MASTYSTDLKLELMATGENAGTWGDNTNNNLNLIQQAIAGYESVALSDGGTVALAMTDKTISNARNMVIKFTGTLTGASTVTIPDSIEKFYIFDLSAVTGVTNLTIKTVSGTGFTTGEAKIVAAYSDGTNLNEIALDTLGGTIGTAQIADNAITSAKISDNQVTTSKVSDLQITTAKIADDAVTPDKLSDTAVTPGSYTSASITVDQQGRITAASSGSAGGKAFVPTLQAEGPASGTHTANPAANLILAYMIGGGGGGGGGAHFSPPAPGPGTGGDGGGGGFGAYYAPISAPFAQPYSVGGGGAGGAGNFGPTAPAGSTGGTTTIATIGTVNGGVGGNGGQRNGVGSAGADGTAPGAYLTYSNKELVVGKSFGNGGTGGVTTPGPGTAGNSGTAGGLAIFENIGA